MKKLGIFLLIWYCITLITNCIEYKYNYMSLITFTTFQICCVGIIIFIIHTLFQDEINCYLLILGLLLIVWFINIISLDMNTKYHISIGLLFAIVDLLTYLYISLYLLNNKIVWHDIKIYTKETTHKDHREDEDGR